VFFKFLYLLTSLCTGCLPALAVKLRFHLNGRDATARQKSLHWQDAFIDAMLLYRSDVIDVAFVAADSLQVRHVTQAPACAIELPGLVRFLNLACSLFHVEY